MLNKKFFPAAILSLAVLFTACSTGGTEVSETTASAEITAAEETTETTAEISAPANTTISYEKVTEEIVDEITAIDDASAAIPTALKYYESWVEADMSDLSFLRSVSSELPDEQKNTVKLLRIENPADIDSIKEIAECFPNLKQIEITDKAYSAENSDKYFEVFKNYDFKYSGQSPYYENKDDHNYYYPKRGKNGETGFFIQPCITPFNEDWHNDLELVFTNFTGENVTADELKIYIMNGDTPEALPFADGNYTYKIDMEIPAGEGFEYYNGHDNASLLITEDIFPFSSYSNNRMRAEVTLGGKAFEMDFIITGSSFQETSVAFLDEEQQAAFETAFDAVDALEGCDNGIPDEYAGRSKEEFIQWLCNGLTYDFAVELAERNKYIFDENGNVLYTEKNSGGRGSNITYCGNYFSPFYMSEDECIIRNTVVYWHGDSPYYSTFEDCNYHMIKTEDGWKFDNFRIWY